MNHIPLETAGDLLIHQSSSSIKWGEGKDGVIGECFSEVEGK
jgi:hypothetical protein